MIGMFDLLRRVGGSLVAPRALFASLSPGTGQRDGTILLLAYLLAVGLPGLGESIADARALAGLTAAVALLGGLLPLLPWLIAAPVVEWRLGEARAHRAALCMTPLLVIAGVDHLLRGRGLAPPGPNYAPWVLGGLASLALASVARGSIGEAPTRELSPGTRRAALAAGLTALALVVGNAGLDLARLVRVWPTLAPLTAGDPVPEFDVPLLAGGRLRRAELAGSPTLLIYWTTWCGVCEAEMPMYAELAARHPGLRVIGVHADRDVDSSVVRTYQATHAMPYPIALDDGQLTRGFRVRMYPHLVVLDSTAQVRGVYRGRTLARDLEAAITSAGG